MNKIFLTVLLICLLALTIYGAYYLANKQTCIKLDKPIQSLGGIVLYTEEAKELYDIDSPMYIPTNKLIYEVCE